MRKLFSVIILCCLASFCMSLTGCITFGAKAGGKPDLIVKSIKPEKKLKMGTCNTVKVTVRNKSVNDGSNVTKTKLEVRTGKKKLTGPIVYSAKQNTSALSGKASEKLTFTGVKIPVTEEPSWYTVKAIADDGNAEDEFKEDNNTKYISKFVNEQCD